MAPTRAQEYRTTTGRMEINSETLAAPGQAPMPQWEEDQHEAAEAERWPQRLLTAPGYFHEHPA